MENSKIKDFLHFYKHNTKKKHNFAKKYTIWKLQDRKSMQN